MAPPCDNQGGTTACHHHGVLSAASTVSESLPLWQVIASALGAAFLAQGASVGLRIVEFRREDRARFVADKRELYVQILALISQTGWIRRRALDRIAESTELLEQLEGLIEGRNELEGDERSEEVDRLLTKARAVVEDSELEAAPRTMAHGEALDAAASSIRILAPLHVVQALDSMMTAVLDEDREALHAARVRFVKAARKDLRSPDR